MTPNNGGFFFNVCAVIREGEETADGKLIRHRGNTERLNEPCERENTEDFKSMQNARHKPNPVSFNHHFHDF